MCIIINFILFMLIFVISLEFFLMTLYGADCIIFMYTSQFAKFSMELCLFIVLFFINKSTSNNLILCYAFIYYFEFLIS